MLKQCFQVDFFSPALVASLPVPAHPFVDQDTPLLRIMRLTVRVWQTILTLSFFLQTCIFTKRGLEIPNEQRQMI